MRNIGSKGKPRRAACWRELCSLSLVIISLPLSSFAQIGGSRPLIKYAESQAVKSLDYKSAKTLGFWSFNDALEFLEEDKGIEAGSILPIRISTWSVPVTLVRLDFNGARNAFIAPTLSVGIGYVWISGSSVIDAQSESIRIQPQSSMGIAASFGAINGTTGIEESITVSGVIGFNSMAISLGYDIITETAVLGVGFRVDVFSLSRNAYRISGFSD